MATRNVRTVHACDLALYAEGKGLITRQLDGFAFLTHAGYRFFQRHSHAAHRIVERANAVHIDAAVFIQRDVIFAITGKQAFNAIYHVFRPFVTVLVSAAVWERGIQLIIVLLIYIAVRIDVANQCLGISRTNNHFDGIFHNIHRADHHRIAAGAQSLSAFRLGLVDADEHQCHQVIVVVIPFSLIRHIRFGFA